MRDEHIKNEALIPPDLVVAFIALVQVGSLSAVAQNLGLSPALLQSRIQELESRIGARLLSVVPGLPDRVEPTGHGRLLLPRAMTYIEHAQHLTQGLNAPLPQRELRIVASHYLSTYLLIDRLRDFKQSRPDVAVRLSVRTEIQILSALTQDPGCTLGFCAPIEIPNTLHYRPWFMMDWSLVVPHGHRFASADAVSLTDLVHEPLITFEQGSTGRQHVIDAFRSVGLQPVIGTQATTTALIVQMIDAGLGIAVLPLLPSGKVTRNLNVSVIPLVDQVRPIESGVLMRSEWANDSLAKDFIEFVLAGAL